MKVAFWLIPAQADRTFYQELIDVLANAYDAPVFTPHVTVYSGEYDADEDIAGLIETVTQDMKNFSLKVDKITYSDQFTQSLFVQFHSDSLLNQLCDSFRQHSRQPSNFVLNPHLSLIYRSLREAQKQNLLARLAVPASEVWFQEVCAVVTPAEVQTREDVESWHNLYSKRLLSN